MIYIFAVLFSLIACYQGLLSEIAESNIRYVKAGRQPDAGAVLFPTLLVLLLMFLGVAWLLKTAIPNYATYVFAGLFLILSLCLQRSIAKSKAELKRVIESRKGKTG